MSGGRPPPFAVLLFGAAAAVSGAGLFFAMEGDGNAFAAGGLTAIFALSVAASARLILVRQPAEAQGTAPAASPAPVTAPAAAAPPKPAALGETGVERGGETAPIELFDRLPVAAAALDGDGWVMNANQAFRAMTGLTPPSPFSDLVAEEDRTELDGLIAALLRGEDVEPAKTASLASSQRGVQLLFQPLTPAEGGASLAVVMTDREEQKRLEDRFVQSQKMQAIGQLAGGVAHDFNNLVTAMIGYCDLLLNRHRPGDPSFADLQQIRQNANRAANLVRQLLAFSRQQTLRPKVIDLSETIADLSDLLRRLLGATVDLQVSHGAGLGLVKVDPGQIEQVIINLAVNARDAMAGRSGRLAIRTFNAMADDIQADEPGRGPSGDYVAIEVSDTGTGIAPEILPKIFEPFFTTKDVGQGTGLGLATVYGIVRQTGGFIVPRSTVGEGATFTIYLPRYSGSERPEARGTDQLGMRDLTGHATVLLVEDEDAVRAFATRALEGRGYQVLTAAHAEEALEIFAARGAEIDVLVTDVVMPGMDGVSLLKAARLEHPALKAILVSGYAEEAVRKDMAQSPDVLFLPKPFTLKDLAASVKRLTGNEISK